MKIAVVGSGISGLISAFCLQKHHDVTVFEKNDWVGGHTHTILVENALESIWIDTGFIVCNNKNYSNFLKFLNLLDVRLQKTTMSFSVSSEKKNLEYNGTNLNKLFSQRKNIVNPKFWYLIYEIVRFNKIAKNMIKNPDKRMLFQEFVEEHQFDLFFCQCYLLPMLGAVWSCSYENLHKFPAFFVLNFLNNHGMLNINDRPQWYSLVNGSHTYVNKLLEKKLFKVVTSTPINKVIIKDKVQVIHDRGHDMFDKVIIATHTNDALAMLESMPEDVRHMLMATPYMDNKVTVHTDSSIMPKNKRAWAAWNYHLDNQLELPAVTYYMNELQCLKSKQDYFVSLNMKQSISPQLVIQEYTYSHPSYTIDSYGFQNRHDKININEMIYFVGAYWKNGFHEDGVNSGLQVVQQIDKEVLCEMPFTMEE